MIGDDQFLCKNKLNRITINRHETPLSTARQRFAFAWTGFWIFWIRAPGASNRIRSEVFFHATGSRLDLDFVFTEKTFLVVCLTYIYPDSNRSRIAFNLAGTGTGIDLDSQFAKQDWIRTQKNQSPNNSTARQRCTGSGYQDSSQGKIQQILNKPGRIRSTLLFKFQDPFFKFQFFEI